MFSFFSRIINLISPRGCLVCGNRLAESEHVACAKCSLNLPRTHFASDAYNNEMARIFWGRMPIERCAALYFHRPGSQSANIIYDLKYNQHPQTGQHMGRMMAEEFAERGFFDDIDVIVPIPLTKKRQRKRGYNQSLWIARGVSEQTGLPIEEGIVIRQTHTESQTDKSREERQENVSGVFCIKDATRASGKHILIIDDVVTTGATVISCGNEILKAGNVKISVLSLCFTK